MTRYFCKNRRKNRAVTTVFGTLLFMILILTVVSLLFVAFYNFNNSIQQANATETNRSQEKIVITNIGVSEGKIINVTISNIGSVTSQIKAFYVNNQFICDPSVSTLNPNAAYINSQSSETLNVTPTPFDAKSSLTVATARGIKAIELESNFLNISNSTGIPPETYYGPLRLNFTLFYYRSVDSNGNPLGPWQYGANVSSTVTSPIQWNITVTNIDTRGITLNEYSCLTLVSTGSTGGQFPWFTDYPIQFIAPNQTVTIIYTWSKPLPSLNTLSAQSFNGFSSTTAKVFLTFYGKFSDGTTYGQTIPFEAILRV